MQLRVSLSNYTQTTKLAGLAVHVFLRLLGSICTDERQQVPTGFETILRLNIERGDRTSDNSVSVRDMNPDLSIARPSTAEALGRAWSAKVKRIYLESV